jgi:phosphonate transport system permease protein
MSVIKPQIKEALRKQPNEWALKVFVLLVIITIFVIARDYIPFQGITEQGLLISRNIFNALTNPNQTILFDFVTRDGVPVLIMETAAIAFLGTIFGALISIPFAFLSARNIVPKWVASIGVAVIVVIRTFPAVVYALMFIRVTGPGAFTGVLTLSVASIGMLAKLFAEIIEDLDSGIIEALDASGCNTIQKIQYGIFPQLMSNFASTTIYRFEINVKYATILGMVGAGGIGAPLIFAISAYRWSDAGALLIGLVIFVLIIEMISTRIRKKLATGE